MATRFYFPDNASPATYPPLTVLGSWFDNIVAATVHELSTVKQSTAFNSDTVTNGADTGFLSRRYSIVLAAQTILSATTLNMQIRCLESDAAADARVITGVYIFAADGLTILDTLYEDDVHVEPALTLTNRKGILTDSAVGTYSLGGDVVVPAGAFLVVDVGAWFAHVDALTVSFEFGDNSASDLPQDEIATDQFCPWIEFSQTLTVVTVTGSGSEAVTGSGGVKVGGVGVIVFMTPGLEEVTGSGGVVVGGEGVFRFLDPGTLAVIGEGGVEVGGEGIIEFVSYGIEAVIGHGGVEVGGQGVIEFLDAASTIFAVVGSGGVAVGGAGVIEFLSPSIHEVIGSGGVVVGSFRVPEATVVGFVEYTIGLIAVIGSGSVEVGGAGVIAFTEASIYAVPTPQSVAAADVVVGGASIISFISHQILEVIGEGGVVVGGGEAVPPDVFDTYIMTGVRGEPSIYSNFNFNSYAKYRGKYYGAGATGIFLLEGADDAGEEIYPGVRIGMMNFGTDREKRIRLLRCGGETTGAEVRVSDGNGTSDYAPVERGRAAISRKVQAREILIEISDFESLDHLEIVPLILHKR